jgi:hypothetical protein
MTDHTRPSPKHPCRGTRRDGQPCTTPVLGAGGYCFAHDPARAAQRAAACRKGGYNRRTVRRLRALAPPRLADVYDQLETALGEVHDGTLRPGQAIAMAALARAMAAVLHAGELEQQVRELEGRASR